MTLLLAVTVQPLKTKAVAVVDDVVLLIGSALLAAVGVTITANNSEVVGDFLNSCSDTLREWIYDVCDTWVGGAKKILEVSAEMWDNLQIDAHKYFKNFTSSSIPLCSVVENESGIYGFTEDESTQLKFHVPLLSAQGGRASLFADNYTITYYYNYDAFSLYDFHLLGSYSWYDYKYFSGFTMYFKSNDLTIVLGGQHANMYSSDKDAFDVTCKPYSFNYGVSITNFLTSNIIGTINGNYFKLQSTDAGYAVIDLVTNNLVSLDCKGQSKTYFASQQAFYEWLFESVGLAHQNSAKLFDVAVPSTDTTFNDLASDVVIDKDYFPTDEDVEAETKESVSVVIPATLTDVSTETVLDTSAEDIYDGDLPLVTAPSNLFTDKFPFCLPWDLYNLIASLFSAESSPPSFTLPLPANYNLVIDFGGSDELVTSDETGVTISLSKFDFIVKMLRFFVAGLWVLGLILVSRKLIGGE